MGLNKQNAAPDVTVGAVTGQHLCKSKNSIANTVSPGNENFAGYGSSETRSAGIGYYNVRKSCLGEISMTELYDQVYEPKVPVVDGLLYPGVYIFAGSPKIGKSFFMAQLAYHVSAGIPLWEYPVRQGPVLYLALEDDYYRLQKRLGRMFDAEENDNLYFATEAGTIADGLETQMEQFIIQHSGTSLIIIDTLQRIRETGGEQYSYAKDYEVIKQLKAFADKYSICFLIVHHTRKMGAEDSFDMISGTNGLLGAADGAFVLKKNNRTDRKATLSVVGRDQPDQELKLEFDQEKCFWKFLSAETELWKEPLDPVLEAVAAFVHNDPEIIAGWMGSPTALLEKIREMDPKITIAVNALGRKMNVCAERLYYEYDIHYNSYKTHNGRIIILTKVGWQLPEEQEN